MSGIEWGAPIPVDGVRPGWLGKDDRVWMRWASQKIWSCLNDEFWTAEKWNDDDWARIDQFRLPQSHFYYTVARYNAEHPDEQPFAPWGGGDAAPRDWDGEHALRDDGAMIYAPFLGSDWCWGRGKNNIIGYRPRSPATTFRPETPATPTYNPDTHVLVERVSENVARDRYLNHPAWLMRGMLTSDPYIGVLRDLGIISPTPTH